MIYPKQLQNYFYLIAETGTVFDILTQNDKDGCGVHKVKYILEEEQVDVNVGESYYDDTNTLVYVDGENVQAGMKSVSSGKIDADANSTIFPCLVATTKDSKDNVTTHYQFFQFLIKDGDKFQSGKFVKAHGITETITDYKTEIAYQVNDEIVRLVEQGYTLAAIKRTLPWWAWAQPGDTVYINGKPEEVVTNDFAVANFSNEKIDAAIMAIVEEQINNFANDKLSKHGKKACGLNYTTVDIDEDCE